MYQLSQESEDEG
jgi:hypothetical protein